MDKIKEGIERECPKCKELVKFEATICKHCQADLTNAYVDEKQQLAVLVLSGKPLPEIAKELGVYSQAVKHFLKFHFGEPALAKVKSILEQEGTYLGHPDISAYREALGKKKKKNVTWALVIGGVVVLLLAISGIKNYFKNREAEEQALLAAKEEKAAELARQDSIKKYEEWFTELSPRQQDSVKQVENEKKAAPTLKQINAEIASLIQYTGENLPVKAEDTDIVINGAQLGVWQKLYYDFSLKEGITKELDRKIKEYKRLLPRVLKRQYPVVRRAMIKNWERKMWEHDIGVTGYGVGVKTARFIGGIFASNKAIKEFQSKISDDLRAMRFKRIEYKWYEYDDEYTYYTIESPRDTEIVR